MPIGIPTICWYTSRYLDDIFTIDNPEFEKYIPDIYPAELQLNKANTSDKETSFLDLNIKVIGSDIHTSVYDKRDDFGFPIVNFPWLSGDSHPTVFTFRSWLDLLDVVLAFWISILKISKLLQNCLHRVIDITSFEKHLVPSPILGLASAPIVETKFLELAMSLLDFSPRIPLGTFSILLGKFLRSYSELLSKFGAISFQEYVFKGISHPVFYGDLVYKLRRVKDTPNFISSGSKIVKRLRRRQYDPLIIETTIGLVLGPCTALCRLFLKHCTLTNKAVGTI